jgi:hypothetical protein
VKLFSRRRIGCDGAVGDETGIASLLDSGRSLHGDPEETGSPVIAAFHRMTGDISQTYGLANIEALSAKRQRSLPVGCKVYDLLNFASELATHHADEQGARASQAWLGTLISGEYDLENSCDTFDEFQDFFLDTKLDGEVALDLQKVAV